MNVRKAQLADLDGIVRLWKEMMLFHATQDSYFVMSARAEASYCDYAAGNIQDEAKLVLVCCISDRIIGYVHAAVLDYPPIYPVTRYAEILEIAVTESERRMGAGRLLLQHALDWAREQGMTRVECKVAVHNPVSQGFWKKNGFRGYVEGCVLEY
jgi:ribosomal protein S18 acetylase RimI-like enzyme